MASAFLIAVVVGVQMASGCLWWAWARRARRITIAELLGMGLALGTFVSMLTAMALAHSPLAGFAWALPAAVTLVVLIVLVIARRPAWPSVSAPGRETAAVLIGLVTGGALLIVNWIRVPLDDPTATSFTDRYFFEAISRGLAHFGPGQSILMTGGSLRYHWFTYAWAGELAQTTSAAAFVTITRALPVVTLIGVAMLTAGWAGSLSRVRWVPSLAVLLIVVGGYAGALYGTILNFDSPSQAMTTMWLLALAVAYLTLVRGHIATTGGVAVVAVLAAACTGGKVSHAVVAAGGIAVVTLAGLILRQAWWRRALAGGVAAAIAIVVTYLWVLAGVAVDRNLTEAAAVKASTWQGLDPLVGPLGVALGTLALVLAILARLAGIGWLMGRPRSRTSPDVLFSIGAVVVGLLAMLALSEGVNELWFVLAASAPAAVLSAVGVGAALRSLHRGDRGLRHPLIWAVAAAIPVSLVCLALSRNWSQHQALLNWLSPISVWILAPAVALLIAAWKRPRGAVVRPAIALTVAVLALVSIGTRPAVVWTASRAVSTEVGSLEPPSEVTDSSAGPAPGEPASYSDSVAAADWLNAHTDADAILATSYPLTPIVPALTGRQMYLAGSAYQVGLGGASELAEVRRREAVSLGIQQGLTPQTLRELCDAGVTWVWLDRDAGDAVDLPPAYRNSGVTLVALNPPVCSAG